MRFAYSRPGFLTFKVDSKLQLPDNFAERAVPAATRRLSRAAMFTFATTLTAVGAVAACSSSSSSGPTTGGSDGAVTDDGQVQAAYGCPAPNCGPVDAGPNDDGGAQALYGLAADE